MQPRLLGLVAGLGLSVGGCVGVIGDGADPAAAPGADAAVDAPSADFRVMVTEQATTELGTRITQAVDVTATDFSGPVALAVSGAPAGWTVVLEPSTIVVPAGEVAPPRATLRIDIPTDADPAADGVALTVTGTAAPGVRAATTTITVQNAFTLAIGTPGAQGQHFERFASGQLRMKRGAQLRIVNTDGVAHRIHSDAGVDGFPHQAASMPAGAEYRVTLGASGTDLFYCHDHGQGTGEVRLTVE